MEKEKRCIEKEYIELFLNRIGIFTFEDKSMAFKFCNYIKNNCKDFVVYAYPENMLYPTEQIKKIMEIIRLSKINKENICIVTTSELLFCVINCLINAYDVRHIKKVYDDDNLLIDYEEVQAYHFDGDGFMHELNDDEYRMIEFYDYKSPLVDTNCDEITNIRYQYRKDLYINHDKWKETSSYLSCIYDDKAE